MNVPFPFAPLQRRADADIAKRPPVSSRRERRERDFGIGYGNSSGYGLARHYVQDHGQPLFRCH